ncbi:hypothetical protein PENTCL1PPCAC_11404, partial [Pristionchus entomophagus]
KSRSSQMMGDDSIVEGINHLLEIRKKNGKELKEVLKAVAFRDTGTIDVNEKGIRIVVDDQHNQQGIAYLPNDAFYAVLLKEEMVKLTIPLNALISTLSILDHHESTVRLTYNGYGEQLRVLVEHDDTLVDTMINTLSPSPDLAFDFQKDFLKARVIMKASVLKDAFKELDPSSSGVMFIIGPNSFSIQTKGDVGKITTTIPKHSDFIDSLECDIVTHTVYRLALMKKMDKALAICSKISIRIDKNGIMICQFMLEKCADNYQIFLEFYCAPDADQPYSDDEDGGDCNMDD